MFRTTTGFDHLLDKATSHQNLEPDWAAILQLCDMIRQGDAQPKDAIASIKKKLNNQNPHVVLFALLVLESCVKNCGNLIHDEVGKKVFMEYMIELVKSSQHEDVKNKILELIQAWGHAFRNSPKYRSVLDVVRIMKTEGFQFPKLNESDAMFLADTAPEWLDGEACHRCRIRFSMVQRKHHCRACGQVFCHQCSSKNTTLPKFGIEKEVRVCEDCFDKFTKLATPASTSLKTEELLPAEYLSSSLAQQSQAPPTKPAGGKTEEELKEEEELQLALALSQSEAESQRAKLWSAPTSNFQNESLTAPTHQQNSHGVDSTLGSNPDLAKYLDRNYWEQKKAETSEGKRSRHNSASAPSSQPQRFNNSYSGENLNTSNTQADYKHETNPTGFNHNNQPGYNQNNQAGYKQENNHSGYNQNNQSGYNQNNHSTIVSSPEEHLDSELNDFIHALKSQVEIFVNRMKSNSSRGRHVANDSSVQTLFVNITQLHSRLLVYIQDKDDKRVYYEGLQDKLTQVKDARAALDALRDEAAERSRAEAEAAERAKQIAMAAKLDLMRKKKQEYLQYQRTLALQKVQERELELQQRQRRHLHQQNSQGYYEPGMPQGGPGGPPQYSQPGPPPSYHPYNMMPGPPGSDMWAAPPDSKSMMNPAHLSMGPQSLPPMGHMNQGPQSMNQGPMNQGPQSLNQGPMNQGPQSLNQGSMSQGPQSINQVPPPHQGPMNQGPPSHQVPMNQGPQSLNQGPPGPQQLNQMGPIRPMQPGVPMSPGLPNPMAMGPTNPPGPMNPAQMIPQGPMNPNLPHGAPMPQQPFQGQVLQSGGPGSNTSLPPQQEMKNEDNTAELISFD